MKALTSAVERRGITSRPVSVTDLLELYQPAPRNSMTALLRKMGPFNPSSDAFQFRNSFSFTASELEQLSVVIPATTLDLVHLTCINEIKKTLEGISIDVGVGPVEIASISLYDILGLSVMEGLAAEGFLKLLAEIVDPLRNPVISSGGFCGGMAFGGYDFYLHGWPVARFGGTPPSTGELHDYIFQRLRDSLELNGATFVEWWTKVHVLPNLDEFVNAVVLAAAGSVVAFPPVGTALGAWIGGRIDLFDLGGPQLLLDPTKDQWAIIKDRLDTEAACPVGLILSNKPNILDQHQVLAIGYTDNGVTPTLDIWDNNEGNQPNTLSIDFRGDELEVSVLPGSALVYDRIKGIFLEEYTLRQPPSSLGPP